MTRIAFVKADTKGRYFLEVGGVAVAAEGDYCRDPRLAGPVWTRAMLEEAAVRIQAAVDHPLVTIQ